MSNEFYEVICLFCFANLFFIDVFGLLFFFKFRRRIRDSFGVINSICSAFTVKKDCRAG